MPPVLRNVLAFVAGALVGGVVNMTLVTVGPSLIPLPPGVDGSSAESLRASVHLLQPRHFIMPFLAHALGTLAGATAACMIAASHGTRIALGIGAFFLIGGIAASFMIPAPAWFVALDLAAAYIPMAWLGARLARGLARRDPAAQLDPA